MPWRGKGTRWWNSVCDVSVTFLEVVRDSADALPPLKSAAGFLTSSHKVVERMASVPRIVEDLQFRLATIDEKFHVLLPQTAMLDEDLVKRLTAYDMRLIEVNQELEALRTPKKTVTQLINLRRTESKLGSVSSKLDQAERDLYDLHALHSQRVSKAVCDDVASLHQAIHQTEEKLLLVVSSTYKIGLFFSSGLAWGHGVLKSTRTS
ncbi:hypothetical protein DL96DRAFT_1561244 [Flagelloscypha sp. PMI_526]|nr:hypothetical protein DL96DRAFT_1561244 [Flagelloscypha sp. PMI_526]